MLIIYDLAIYDLQFMYYLVNLNIYLLKGLEI